MGRLGRILFVSVPFLLTAAALICLLVVTVPSDKRYMLELDTQNFTISAADLESDLESWFDKRDLPQTIEKRVVYTVHQVQRRDIISAAESAASSLLGDVPTDVASAASAYATNTGALSSIAAVATSVASGGNLTADDLGLADSYTFGLWNFCSNKDGNQTCSPDTFNYISKTWDDSALNKTLTALGYTIPSDVDDAVKLYGTMVEVTEVLFIAANIAVAVEIVFGIFALFSRAGSCCTWIVSGIANLILIAAAVMATVIAVIVVGLFEGVGQDYGLHASVNTGFLTAAWLAVACSLGASFFWAFTICCCASTSSRKKQPEFYNDAEKQTSAYHPVAEPTYTAGAYDGQQHGIYEPQQYAYGQSQPEHGMPGYNPQYKTNVGYEPYSHAAV